MTLHNEMPSPHRAWRGAYRALLALLPQTLRDKHGDAMLDLYVRELQRSEPRGALAVWAVGASGLCDLIRRGTYERVVEERAELSGQNLTVLRTSVAAFVVAFFALTSVLVANYVSHHLNYAMTDVVLFSIPFTAALTVPMAVFMAVLWTATNGSKTGSLRTIPIVVLASVVSLGALGLNIELVPRANRQLQAVFARTTSTPLSDRSMTLGELRAASTRIESEALANVDDVTATRRQREVLVNYGVEIHKKLALAAACVVLALLAAGIARHAPRAGLLLQLIVSVTVFSGYYIAIMTGESLADRALVSPAIAMWSANAIALVVAIAALWFARRPTAGPARAALYGSTTTAWP